MSVRSADPDEDAAAVAAIYAPYVEDSAVSFETEAPSAEEMADRMRDAHEWLVAERDGAVVGYAYGGVHRTRAAYNRTVEVSAYVDSTAHRAGVGRELYEELFRRLKQRGFRLLVAGVTMPNEPSVGLHESLGFELVGVFHNVGFKSGQWWDVGWWELDLGEPRSKPSE